MREHFELEGNGKNVLIISASIGCQKSDITGYAISEIAKYSSKDLIIIYTNQY